jgi:uncharacterized protein (UPF0335 family)
MKEEIASLILGEIHQLVSQIEQLQEKQAHLEKQLSQHMLEKNKQLFDQQLLPYMQKEMHQLSKDYLISIANELHHQVDLAKEDIKSWDKEVLALLKLTRKNYLWLFALALTSGILGAGLALVINYFMKMTP